MAINARTLALIEDARKALNGLADGATRSLTAAWVRAWDTLAVEFGEAVKELIKLGGTRWPSRTQIDRAARTSAALAVAARALGRLAGQARTEIASAARQAVDGAHAAQEALAVSQLPPGAQVRFRRADHNALAQIINRTAQQIHAATRPLTEQMIAAMRRELIRGVALGSNPRAVARALLDRLQGAFAGGLSRALNIARTEILDAYRGAAMLSQAANSDVVGGWMWISALTPRTCFPAGTPITTPRGPVAIEDVQAGDEVLTHRGRWRPVVAPMQRRYRGEMVTVQAGDLRVTATADHPFLVERQGELEWLEAGELRVGDHVLSDREAVTDPVGHVGAEVSVERGGHDPHNLESAGVQEGGLRGIPLSDLVVPVGLVHLDDDSAGVQHEVDGAPPAGNRSLLLVADAERFQREPNIALRHSFAGMPAVAANRAEPGLSTRGNNSNPLPARKALDLDWRPAAYLRAVCMPWPTDQKGCTAAGAWAILRRHIRAIDGTVRLVRSTSRNRELLAAPAARLRDVPRGAEACTRAVPARVGRKGQELLAAGWAFLGHARRGNASAPGVGVSPLMGGVAVRAAELPRPSSRPRCRDLELRPTPEALSFLADIVLPLGSVRVGALASTILLLRSRRLESDSAALASGLHKHIVSRIDKCFSETTVYNFEVQEDRSYVAGGMAVHNCGVCWSLHGTVFPLDQPGPWDHPSGRCSRTPVVRSWADLGFDAPEPASIIPDARQMFDALPPDAQLRIMGPTRLALLKSGAIDFPDLARVRPNPGWRPSYAPVPVADLAAAAA